MRSITGKYTEEELKWRRRNDADILAQAEMIKSDKQRYAEAIRGAREITQERVEQVRGIAKVAGMKTPTVPKTEERENNGEIFAGTRYKNPATLGRF